MKISAHELVNLLEREMTEARCDALALVVSRMIPGPKIIGAIAYGVIDQVTPEILFRGLRSVFHQEAEIEIDESTQIPEQRKK